MKHLLITCALGMSSLIPSLHAQELDITFGDNGVIPFYYSSAPGATYVGTNTNSNGNYGKGLASAIQADGKIVTSLYWGSSGSNLMMSVYRYMPNGLPDYEFGEDGVARIFTGTNSKGHDIAIQPDGKIVIVGESEYCTNYICGAPQFVMMRLHPNGTLDTSFGVNGHLLTEDVYGATGNFAFPKRLHILPDGKFIVGGKGPSGRPSVVRLNSNGMPDPTFGQNGVYVLSHIPRSTFADMQVSETGEIYSLYMRDTYNASQGGYDPTNHSDFGIFKLTNTGTLDSNFGQNGMVERDMEISEEPTSLLLTSSNKLIAVGIKMAMHRWFDQSNNALYGTTERGFAASFLTNGEIDLSIPNGYTTYHFPEDSATYINRIIEYSPNEYILTGKTVNRYNPGYYVRKGLVVSITQDLQLNLDFNGSGHMKFMHGVPSTSASQTVSDLFDIDLTADNGLLFTGERNPTEALGRKGIYLMKIKRNLNDGLSLEYNPSDFGVSIYPNPITNNQLTVEMEEGDAHLRIHTLDGKLLYQGNMVQGLNAISLNNDFRGMAIATITSGDGKVLTQKLNIY